MSSVWQYFTKIKDPDSGKVTHGKCNQCPSKITSNGTSSMKAHLKKHGIAITLGKNVSSTSLSTTIEVVQPTINSYFSTVNNDSLCARLAKLCAKRGLSFSTVASEEMVELMELAGFEQVPKSPNTVKKRVSGFAKEVKNSYKNEIASELKNVKVLSVGIDEWTSRGNNRFMNVILFSDNKLWNLGLIKIHGKTSGKLSANDLVSKLNEFNVSVFNLICLMTDGAAINKCIATEINLIQQECLAHGAQLAVKKALYSNSNDEEYESDSESEDEDEVEPDELGFLAFEEVFPKNQALNI